MSPRLRVAVWAAVLGIMLFTALNLRRTDDLGRLLPTEGALSEAAHAALENRAADVVLIEVNGTGATTEQLTAAVEAVDAAAEATGRFVRVRGRIDALGDGQRIRDIAVRHAVELLPKEDLADAMSEAGVRKALLGWQAKLFGPAGGLAARGLVEDPLDLGGRALDRLRETAGPWQVKADGGLLLDVSGQRALIVATPHRSAFAAAEDTSFADEMERILAASPLPARWFGGARIATDMASSVQRDVNVAGGASLLTLFIVLALGFRSTRPLAGLVAPLVVTVGAVAAVLALRSPIHGVSLGFGGALLGIAVDYWVHLYVGAARRYAGPDRALRFDAAREAWRELTLPLLVSSATTIAAFGVLLLSRFPVVRDLGWAGMAAIAGALGGVAVIGPVSYAWVGGAPSRAEIPLAPRWAAWAVLIGVAALGIGAFEVRFDGDPRHLLAVGEETAALQDELAARYGGVGTSGVVIVRSPDAGRALDATAEVEEVLTDVPGASVAGPSVLVPGPALIAGRRAVVPDREVLRGRVIAAATELGFDAEALLPAVDRYVTPPNPPLSPSTWADTPLAEVVDRNIGPDGVSLEVMLVDPSVAETVAPRLPPEATLVVPTALAATGVAEIGRELARLGGLSAVLVLGLLVVRYREPVRVCAAALPVAAALVSTLGVMGLLGWPLDAVSTSVLVLILGLAVDYGVFLADGGGHATAVGLAALTSIAGFGPMALSRSQALAGAGLVVAVGLGAALLTAVAVTPRIVDGTLLGPRGRRYARGLLVGGLVALHVELLVLIRFVAPTPAVPGIGRLPGWTGADDDRMTDHGRLVRRHGVWTMAVDGTPAEMGTAHGRLTSDLRIELERATTDAFDRAVPNALARAAIVEGVMIAGAGLDRHVNDRIRQELGAIAASAPDPRRWLLPAYTRTLYFHALHDIGQTLVDSPMVACSGFLATGAATRDGHTLLARSFDFEGGEAFDTDKIVIVRQPPDKLATVSVAFPGMVGVVSGINERRIAVALQAAGSETPPHLATPMTLVLRRVLEEARSLDEVALILDEARGFGTELVLAVDGARDQTALFEVTPSRVERLPAADLLGVTNHLRSDVFAADAENARRMANQTTVHRLERLDELITARRGALDLPAAVEVLRDRSGLGGAPLPRGHRWALDADIATHAIAIDATAGTLWVSVSPNLSGGFVAYQLSDLLAGQLDPEPVVPPSSVALALTSHRGRALLREARRSRDPEPLVREALRHLPDHPEVLLSLAEVLADQGADPAEIVDLLDRAERAPPEDAQDRARLAALRAEVSP